MEGGCSRELGLCLTRLENTSPSPQAPMSRVELDTFINDRYAAIEDRLQVCSLPERIQATQRDSPLQILKLV